MTHVHHMHSLRHGLVLGQAPRPRGLAALCVRHPNHTMATAHAVTTIMHACIAIWLSSLGLPVAAILSINYGMSYIFGVPMHALTLRLARRD